LQKITICPAVFNGMVAAPDQFAFKAVTPHNPFHIVKTTPDNATITRGLGIENAAHPQLG